MHFREWQPDRIEQRVADILGAIEQIRAYTKTSDERSFLADDLRQDAVALQLLIIAEATDKIFDLERRKNVPDDLRIAHRMPEIPWREVRDLGIRVRHIYAKLDPEIIWDIASGSDLPQLETALKGAFGGT